MAGVYYLLQDSTGFDRMMHGKSPKKQEKQRSLEDFIVSMQRVISPQKSQASHTRYRFLRNTRLWHRTLKMSNCRQFPYFSRPPQKHARIICIELESLNIRFPHSCLFPSKGFSHNQPPTTDNNNTLFVPSLDPLQV